MALVRMLLVVVLTLFTSLSGGMAAGHMPASPHDHAAAEAMTDEQPVCCQESTDSAHTCHALSALLPALDAHRAAPEMRADVFCISSLLLTGVEPSGPLDPPRAV